MCLKESDLCHVETFVHSYNEGALPFLFSLIISSLRIYFVEKPLRQEHLRVLEATKCREDNIGLSASWATKGYALTLEEVLFSLVDITVLERVQLDGRSTDEESKKHNQREAERFVELCISMVCTRAWSMAYHSHCHPDKWAGVLHADKEVAKNIYKDIQRDARIIVTATQKLSSMDDLTDTQVWVL